MVGARKIVRQAGHQHREACMSHQRLSNLRQAQRRNVAGSGKRLGSFVWGVDCSQLTLSQLTPMLVAGNSNCNVRKEATRWGER